MVTVIDIDQVEQPGKDKGLDANPETPAKHAAAAVTGQPPGIVENRGEAIVTAEFFDVVLIDNFASHQVGTGEVDVPDINADPVGTFELLQAAQPSPTQVSVAEIGLVDIGQGEVGSLHIGFAQITAVQIGFPDTGLAEIGAAQVDVFQVGSTQARFPQVGAKQTGSFEPGKPESCAEGSTSFKVGAAQVGPGQFGPLKVGVNQAGSTQLRLEESRAREICSVQVDSDQVSPGQVAAREVNSGKEIAWTGFDLLFLCRGKVGRGHSCQAPKCEPCVGPLWTFSTGKGFTFSHRAGHRDLLTVPVWDATTQKFC